MSQPERVAEALRVIHYCGGRDVNEWLDERRGDA